MMRSRFLDSLESISIYEFTDWILSARSPASVIEITLVAYYYLPLHRQTSNMRFLDGSFSNEDCAGLEMSHGRWKAFSCSCRYLTSAEILLLARETAREVLMQGGLS